MIRERGSVRAFWGGSGAVMVAMAIVTQVPPTSAGEGPKRKRHVADADTSERAVFWGPEEFVRRKGRPVEETHEVSAVGFGPPFVLHMQNGGAEGKEKGKGKGKGKGRKKHRHGRACSAGVVSVDGTPVLGPAHFTKKKIHAELPLMLGDPSSVSVRLTCKPGARITLWLEGTPLTQTVGPEGGTLSFPNGVSLEVPPDAVSEEVEIGVRDRSCEAVDAIVATRDRDFSTQQKRCLRALELEPDGLQFAVPIRARMEAAPLGPGEFPLLLQVDEGRGVYWPTDTHILGAPAEGAFDVEVRHFSELAIVASSFEWKCGTAEQCNVLSQKCSSCDVFTESECAKLDPIQPACCTIPPLARSACFADCNCCKEQAIEIVTEDANFDGKFGSDECALVSGTVKVKFTACDGDPVSEQTIAGKSVGCPEDMDFSIAIEPPPSDMLVCSTQTLSATLTARSQDGNVVIKTMGAGGLWDSDAPQFARFADPGQGVVRSDFPAGHPRGTDGVARLRVQTTDGAYASDPAEIRIRDRVARVESATETPGVGEAVVLSLGSAPRAVAMEVEGLCGGPEGLFGGESQACSASWELGGGIATVDAGGTVVPLQLGEAPLRATLLAPVPADCGVSFEAETVLRVELGLYRGSASLFGQDGCTNISLSGTLTITGGTEQASAELEGTQVLSGCHGTSTSPASMVFSPLQVSGGQITGSGPVPESGGRVVWELSGSISGPSATGSISVTDTGPFGGALQGSFTATAVQDP